MRKIVFTLLMLLVSGAVAASEYVAELNYTFLLIKEPQLKIKIELLYKTNDVRYSDFVMDEGWAGERDFYKDIECPEFFDSNETPLKFKAIKPNIWRVEHKPFEIIKVLYFIPERSKDYTINPQTRFRPIVQENFMHLIGYSSLIHPRKTPNNAKMRITLNWKDFKKYGWRVISSISAAQEGFDQEMMFGDFVRSLFIAGKYRTVRVPINGKPLYITITGNWRFKDKEIYEFVSRIVKKERDFWNDYDEPYYLVSLMPMSPIKNGTITGGTSLYRAFDMYLTENVELDDLILKDLVAHEYFHNWNGGKIGRIAKEEEGLYWFSEGFTAYYTWLMLLRSGMIQEEEFLDKINDIVLGYYTNPYRGANNKKIIRDFWNDADVHSLPYQRGAVLAARWDSIIRKISNGQKSLDDFMKKLLYYCKDKGKKLSTQFIVEVSEEFYPDGFNDEVKKYAHNGELIPITADMFGGEYIVEWQEESLFDPGFDLKKSIELKKVTGVVKGSSADKGGLVNGQKTCGWSYFWGQIDKPVEIKPCDSEKTISYYPVGKKIQVPQFAENAHSNPLFTCTKFCTADNRPIEKYDYIWKELRDFYGKYMPKKITVKYVGRRGGSFYLQSESIRTAVDGPDYIVAHEASHVALGKMAKGVSNTENFRFIDEGWASIVGTWFNEYKNTYKRTAIREALEMKSEKGISFEDVKSWTSYFGPWEIASVGQNQRNYKAYSVGSSFVYYLIDNYGDRKLKEFFIQLGQIRDLDKTLQRVYKKTSSQIEKEWLEYISST